MQLSTKLVYFNEFIYLPLQCCITQCYMLTSNKNANMKAQPALNHINFHYLLNKTL